MQSWDSQNGPRPLSQLSTQSWDSQNGPRPLRESSFISASSQSDLPQTPKKGPYAPTLTRTDRIRIKTAFDFNISPEEIRKQYGYTISQIQRAKNLRLTPQVHRRGAKPKIDTPRRSALEKWLLESPSRRYVTWRHIREIAPPDLRLQDCGPYAMRTAFKLVGYGRRVAKRKGFSDDPEVIQERVDFAEEGLTWTPERLFYQIFSDEV
ncbi:uncharacterized protein K444DRAFT_528483, partial [Hyaloscypha bicolor E]